MRGFFSALYSALAVFCFVYYFAGGPTKCLYYGFGAVAFSLLYEIAANTERP